MLPNQEVGIDQSYEEPGIWSLYYWLHIIHKNHQIKCEFMTEKFDENLHFKIGKIKCGRMYCHDMGLPCPYSIRLLRFKLMQKIIQPIKKDSTDIAKNEDDLLKITFFSWPWFLQFISPEWHVSTYQKAFSPLVEHKESQFEILPIKSDERLKDEKIDILTAKIRWLYKKSPKYKEKVDILIQKAQEEIVLPFFEIKKQQVKNRYVNGIKWTGKNYHNH